MTLSMLPGDRSAEGEAATTAEGDLAAWVCGCTSATGRGGGNGGNSGVVVAGALITEQNEEGGEGEFVMFLKPAMGWRERHQ